MADRRTVRSGSRRNTPASQASRKRGMRSASRDVEPSVEPARPLRRSTRQASVTSIIEEQEEDNDASRTKRISPGM